MPKGVIKASKRIRFYPEKEDCYFEAIYLYRQAYNLAVERYKEGSYLDNEGKFINLRPWVKGLLKPQQAAAGRVYNSLICDNAVREAESKFKEILNKNKGKKAQDGLSKIGFKSRKGDFHTFRMCRLPVGLKPAKTSLGDITLTESVPKEAIDKSFSVSFDKGRWFISVLQFIELQPENQGRVKCVAIDPGSRTFATCYSPSEVVIAGDSFAQKQLFPLMKKVDALLGQRQRIPNQNKGIKFIDMPQWARDRLTFIDKEMRRIKSKKDDLVRDMHHRLADYLTREYDVIFLPHFQTQKMVKRKKGRVIRRNTCRQMLNLCHYQFKLVLKWYASKRGKRVIDSNESYTSKTLSHSGKVLENLGGKKQIKDEGLIIDRDVNGARGIFIKTLLQVT